MINTIFVGNGPVVLDNKAGEKIDGYDCVVRFNNFKLRDFEEHVGTKTDIWITRICETIVYKKPDEYKRIMGVINHCRWTPAIYRILPQFQNTYPNLELIDDTHVKEYSQMFGYDHKNRWLSVGMISILFFLQHFKNHKITLYGFGGDINKHYFPKKPQGQEHHNFAAEKNVIDNLVKQGRLELL